METGEQRVHELFSYLHADLLAFNGLFGGYTAWKSSLQVNIDLVGDLLLTRKN